VCALCVVCEVCEVSGLNCSPRRTLIFYLLNARRRTRIDTKGMALWGHPVKQRLLSSIH